MPLLLQPPPIIHQIIQIPLHGPLTRFGLHGHSGREDLHLQFPPRADRGAQILLVVFATGPLEDLLHAGRVELAADAVGDVFRDGGDRGGEVEGARRCHERADGVVVAEFADGEFGDECVEVPVAADEDLIPCAFANHGFLLVVPHEIGHVGFRAGGEGFLGGFFAFVNVLAEARVVEAEGARAWGAVDLMAFVAEKGSLQVWEQGFHAVHAVGADLEVGEMVVIVVGVLVFDVVPISLGGGGSRARLVILAHFCELDEEAGIGLL